MDLNKFSTTAQSEEVDFNNLPAQMGSFPDPPQPGPFRFELPKSLSVANFEERDDKEDPKKKWLGVHFDSNAPLLIVQSSRGTYNGDPFQTRISNQPRKRGKGDDAPRVSDMSYLAAALGAEARPANNRAWVEWLISQAQAGKQFAADIEFSYQCRADKPIYADDGNGTVQEVPNQMGCGMRYYQKDAPKAEDGSFALRITCQCGASLRANANLVRFRA